MQEGSTKVLAAAAAGNGLHDGSIQQRAVYVVEKLYFDEVSLHVGPLMLHSRKFSSLCFGHTLAARDGPRLRLNTSPGYPRLITGRPVEKPTGMETHRSESLVITGLRGSECVFWVLRVPATGTCKTIVFLNFILCSKNNLYK